MNIVSLCLLGCPCRYNGKAKTNEFIVDRLKEEAMLPICPENLAGFPTPRHRIYIEDGTGEDVLDGSARVVTEDGRDVTEDLLRVARIVELQIETLGVKKAYLQERSPSCGPTRTAGPEGERSGMGVIAAVLHRAGVEVVGME